MLGWEWVGERRPHRACPSLGPGAQVCGAGAPCREAGEPHLDPCCLLLLEISVPSEDSSLLLQLVTKIKRFREGSHLLRASHKENGLAVATGE